MVTDTNDSARPPRAGFTLLELVVVVVVCGVLLALILPAVQASREAARQTGCRNNLRTLALAGLSFEATHARLPGAYFGADPDRQPAAAYRGLFVELMPFAEAGPPYEALDKSESVFADGNRAILGRRPAWLGCPSVPEGGPLRGLAADFAGKAVEGLDAPLAHYAGNGGAYRGRSAGGLARFAFGTVLPHVESVSRRRRLADVLDGGSNTLFFWDCAGDQSYEAGKGGRPWSEAAPAGFSFVLDSEGRRVINCPTRAATRSYHLSWASLAQGAITLLAVGGDVLPALNRQNTLAQPFSHHPGICNLATADGGVRAWSETTDALVIRAMATANGG